MITIKVSLILLKIIANSKRKYQKEKLNIKIVIKKNKKKRIIQKVFKALFKKEYKKSKII
jgi:hypothetical protein